MRQERWFLPPQHRKLACLLKKIGLLVPQKLEAQKRQGVVR